MPLDAALHAPSVWERARDDYLCGDTAAEVCARHGVSRSQFYAQARMGGWRKADQPGVAPQPFAGAPEPDVDDGAPARPTVQLAGDALRRAARAIAQGRLREAQGWTRLAAHLRALAVEEAPTANTWLGALAAQAAAEPQAEAAPEAAEPLADLVSRVEEIGAIARDGAALLDADAQDGGDAARALFARVEALEAQAGDRTPTPSAAGRPAASDAPTPSPARIPDAGPDSPDELFALAESGEDARPILPRFDGVDGSPEWVAYCRARAAERPHQTFWTTWADMAEETLTRRGRT